MTEIKENTKDNWTHFPVIRKSDKTIVSFIDAIEGVQVQISMEVDKDNIIISKKITPLNELLA